MLTKRWILSVILALALIAGLGLGVGRVLAQHEGHGGMQGGMPENESMTCCQGDQGMMHSPVQMAQMMGHMAENPAMLKEHMTTMLQHAELHKALVALLKKDDQFRQDFEKLLTEAKQ